MLSKEDKKALSLLAGILEISPVSAPPIFLMINGMRPGEQRKTETCIAVYHLHHPSIKKYSGTLIVTHTYVGAYEVSVPARIDPLTSVVPGPDTAAIARNSYLALQRHWEALPLLPLVFDMGNGL